MLGLSEGEGDRLADGDRLGEMLGLIDGDGVANSPSSTYR
jgi:hypothetical protein